jgi:hypothetical protein
MKVIRFNIFETNSSSTHSLCICTEDEYEKWKNGDLIYSYWENDMIEPPDNLDELLDEDSPEFDEDAQYDYRTYDYEDDYLEWYDYHFTTPSGDKMVAFGWYGHD